MTPHLKGHKKKKRANSDLKHFSDAPNQNSDLDLAKPKRLDLNRE